MGQTRVDTRVAASVSIGNSSQSRERRGKVPKGQAGCRSASASSNTWRTRQRRPSTSGPTRVRDDQQNEAAEVLRATRMPREESASRRDRTSKAYLPSPSFGFRQCRMGHSGSAPREAQEARSGKPHFERTSHTFLEKMRTWARQRSRRPTERLSPSPRPYRLDDDCPTSSSTEGARGRGAR